MMVWQAELHQGKHSIILDAKKIEAREVIQRAIKAADVVLLNKMDNQLVSLGLNREALDVANRKAIPRQPQATAAPRLHLGCTSAAPRLHLGRSHLQVVDETLVFRCRATVSLCGPHPSASPRAPARKLLGTCA